MRLNINGSMFLYKKTKKQIEGNKFNERFDEVRLGVFYIKIPINIWLICIK